MNLFSQNTLQSPLNLSIDRPKGTHNALYPGNNQETELQTPIDLALDSWQNLNIAIPVFDGNVDIRNLDDDGIMLNSETNIDMEINNLLINDSTENTTNVSNEASFMDTASDSESSLSAGFTLAGFDSSFVTSGAMSDTENSLENAAASYDEVTANTGNGGEVIGNATDATIESPAESSVVDSEIDTGTASDNFSNSSGVIGNSGVVEDTSNEIQVDEALTDSVISNEMSDSPGSPEDSVNSSDDGTTNTDNGSWVFSHDAGTIWSFEPPLVSNEANIINNETDTDTANDDFSNGVIDNPDAVGNEIQIDDPLTDRVDVIDDSILDDLVIANESFGIDSINLDEPIRNYTDLLKDNIPVSLRWSVFTVADADIINFGGLNPNIVKVISARDIDLISNFRESVDSVTIDETALTISAGNNITAFNPDIFIDRILTSNENNYSTYSSVEDTDNGAFIHLIGSNEEINSEVWIS